MESYICHIPTPVEMEKWVFVVQESDFSFELRIRKGTSEHYYKSSEVFATFSTLSIVQEVTESFIFTHNKYFMNLLLFSY